MSPVLLPCLVALPILAAGIAAALPSEPQRPVLLPLAALGHLALTLWALATPDPSALGGWLALDPPGRLVLLLLSVLFTLCAFYAVGYLRHRRDLSNRVFVPCLLGFLGMTSLVVCAQHLGLMWVAVEAATLTTAPLIYFNRTQRSIEATWKYLLVGSVGIALALLGSFFLAYASLGGGSSLLFSDLMARADQMSRAWLQVAFVLLVVTLSITPIRRLTGWNQAIKLRKMLGNWSAAYAVAHVTIYVWLDHGLDWHSIWTDALEHRRIFLGLLAFLILLILSATSPTFMIARLGRRWATIHKLVYAAVVLALVHFALTQKLDWREPLGWGAVVVGLFWLWFRDRPAQHPGCNDAERDLIRAGTAPARSADGGHAWPGVGALAARVTVWAMCIADLPTSAGFGRRCGVTSCFVSASACAAERK